MGKFLGSVLVVASTLFADAPPRVLDAGTWVRKSFSVAPGAVEDCPSHEVFVHRAEEFFHLRMTPPLFRDEVKARARHRANNQFAACQEMRVGLEQGLNRDWSGLLSMERFDSNPLDRSRLLEASEFLLVKGHGGIEARMQTLFGDSLRHLLAQTALTRSSHLEADYQKNSKMTEKLKTDDLTESELSIVRNSAYVLLVSARRPDLVTVGQKSGIMASAILDVRMYSFNPVNRTFKLAYATQTSGSSDEGSPEAMGRSIATATGRVQASILELPEFRFTSQSTSLAGNALRPAIVLDANTKADLRVHRRFRYIETQVGKDGSEHQEQIGYGFIDGFGEKDSSYEIRHIGGQTPYVGMTVEEVPGTWWGTFGYCPSVTEVASPVPQRDATGDRLVLRHLSYAPTFRAQFRGNAPGDGVYQYAGADLALGFANATGDLEHFTQGKKDTTYHNNLPVSSLGQFELSLHWGLRFPVRRLFLVAGAQAGFRASWLSFDDEVQNMQVADQSVWTHTPTEKTAYWNTDISSARSVDGWLGLVAGAQWSMSVESGLGVQLSWEALRARSDWEIYEGKSDHFSVPSNEGGFGRTQLTFQWVFR
jgi:hypothetical protein